MKHSPVASTASIATRLQVRRPWREQVSTGLFLSPWIITFLAFSAYPIIYSFYLSFTKYNPLTGQPPMWIGLQNFQALLSDLGFRQALRNTFVFVVGTIPVTTTVAVILANILNQDLRGRGFFRATYFLPSVTSMTVIATIFVYIYAPFGPLNSLTALLGVARTSWLLSTRWALPAIMAMDIWSSFGYYTLLFLAGLQAIPPELHEAAAVDGASSSQRFVWVTLPLLKPMLAFVVIINTIRSFQIFAEIFVMTQGGPLGSTSTMVYYLYTAAFQRFNLGYASAMAYVLFAIILLFSLVQYRLLRAQGAYE